MADPFISPQDVVDYLGRGTATDAILVMATDAACDTVRTYTEQTFNGGTSTVTLDGTGTDAILLPERPVNSVGTVTVNGGTVTDYVLNGNGILFRGSVGVNQGSTWPMGRQNVSVTYSHGYAEVDLPRDVRRVALEIAARTAGQGIARQESVGPVSITYAGASTDLSKGEMIILGKYRHIR